MCLRSSAPHCPKLTVSGSRLLVGGGGDGDGNGVGGGDGDDDGALLVGGGDDGRLAPALAVSLHLHGETVLVALAQRAQLHPPPSLAVTIF